MKYSFEQEFDEETIRCNYCHEIYKHENKLIIIKGKYCCPECKRPEGMRGCCKNQKVHCEKCNKQMKRAIENRGNIICLDCLIKEQKTPIKDIKEIEKREKIGEAVYRKTMDYIKYHTEVIDRWKN